jgi:hypothetical protein
MRKSPNKEIERYLRTGEHDQYYSAWPGNSFLDRANHGDAALRRALVAEVLRRTQHAAGPEVCADLDVVALTRTKVAPMVLGLFPRHEQQTVLELLERSVVFLTPSNIATILAQTRWPMTAWTLANLYLESFGVELLSDDAPRLVGLSEETICYVSMAGNASWSDALLPRPAPCRPSPATGVGPCSPVQARQSTPRLRAHASSCLSIGTGTTSTPSASG